jgi:MtN3 and saliva related transmembrane protein
MTNFSIQVIGIIAGCMTSLSMIPQLIKLIKSKEANDVSIFMIVLLLIGVALWVVYGILKQDVPIITTNCFSFALNLLLLAFLIKYKKSGLR